MLIGDNIQINGLSRDVNGNTLVNIEHMVSGKKKSIQYTDTGLSSMDIEYLVDFMTTDLNTLMYKNQFDHIKSSM